MNFDIESNWNDMAKAYEDFTENPQSYSYKIEWPCIKNMLPHMENKNILDLGGGTGRFASLLSEYNPESITVVDISEKMLSIGRQKTDKIKSKIEFVKADICDLKEFQNNAYDFIFSSTTFHYLENLETIFSNISRLLKSGSKAIISTMHPVYTAQYPIADGENFPTEGDWEVRYMDKRKRSYIQPWIEFNPEIENYLSASYHHTMSDYINAIHNAGLTVERLEEPLPPIEWQNEFPSRFNSFVKTPTFLIFSLSKQ